MPEYKMTCEYASCNRSGRDYIRPKHLDEKGWEGEPIYLCEDHAKELKVTDINCQYCNGSGKFGIDFVGNCRFCHGTGKMKIL